MTALEAMLHPLRVRRQAHVVGGKRARKLAQRARLLAWHLHLEALIEMGVVSREGT